MRVLFIIAGVFFSGGRLEEGADCQAEFAGVFDGEDRYWRLR